MARLSDRELGALARAISGRLQAVVPEGGKTEIARDPKKRWPRAANGTPGVRDSGKDFPDPEAAVVSGTLRLWYGTGTRGDPLWSFRLSPWRG
ncbi:MAG: hypothetical protein AVDCRST_MAG02-2140 [uncultured Rubrobacteraceae bacterium]|uniref:Uncharacterized protein n=1 Tax=uncultured Rubrobacteraceae bacterium TaxID=349277 RepID=A0A6J4R4R4_9ACTN|nr:MAG: hypothetical protein AVDCRST_MAG02-2140 [uncultured Rubrobacteraceae bacterium]